MRVAVVTVGDELLAGDTVNTNAAWLGSELRKLGAHVERVIVVPDRVGDIAQVVNESRAQYDAVIVTGGLGPTHDDLTIEGVAAAVGLPVEENEAAIEWFDQHRSYSSGDLVDGTTALPAGARMLPNEAGVAPGAVVVADDDVPIYVFPGVPEEMKAMFDLVREEFTGAPRERVFVEVSEPESALIDRLELLQTKFGVIVGSYPGTDGVRIRIEGENTDDVMDAADWFRARADVIER